MLIAGRSWGVTNTTTELMDLSNNTHPSCVCNHTIAQLSEPRKGAVGALTNGHPVVCSGGWFKTEYEKGCVIYKKPAGQTTWQWVHLVLSLIHI